MPVLVTSGGNHLEAYSNLFIWGPTPPPPRSGISWWQLKMKHVWFPSGQYVSNWNAVLLGINLTGLNGQLLFSNVFQKYLLLSYTVKHLTTSCFGRSAVSVSHLLFRVEWSPKSTLIKSKFTVWPLKSSFRMRLWFAWLFYYYSCGSDTLAKQTNLWIHMFEVN